MPVCGCVGVRVCVPGVGGGGVLFPPHEQPHAISFYSVHFRFILRWMPLLC